MNGQLNKMRVIWFLHANEIIFNDLKQDGLKFATTFSFVHHYSHIRTFLVVVDEKSNPLTELK